MPRFSILAPVLVGVASASRSALFWLVPYDNVTSVSGYLNIWSQFSTLSWKDGLLAAGSAYALKHNGTLGYADTTAGEGLYGTTMEAYGFPALKQMGLKTLAMTYFTHYDGIAICLKNPQPFVTALVDKCVQYGLDGVDLDYEPQNVARAVADITSSHGWDASKPDPFLSFLTLLSGQLSSKGMVLTVDVNGNCEDQGNCTAFVDTGIASINTETSFGIQSVAEFKALMAANSSANALCKWAPGFGPAGSGQQAISTVLKYAASAAANVTRISTWAAHEYNVGPQPQWLFDAVGTFVQTA